MALNTPEIEKYLIQQNPNWRKTLTEENKQLILEVFNASDNGITNNGFFSNMRMHLSSEAAEEQEYTSQVAKLKEACIKAGVKYLDIQANIDAIRNDPNKIDISDVLRNGATEQELTDFQDAQSLAYSTLNETLVKIYIAARELLYSHAEIAS